MLLREAIFDQQELTKSWMTNHDLHIHKSPFTDFLKHSSKTKLDLES